MAELTCPKCESAMRSYERSGVTIDQCTNCKGIFLDRGELERLVEAEDTHYGGGGAAQGGQMQPGYEEPRRRGFLGGMFEGGHGGSSGHGGRRSGHH